MLPVAPRSDTATTTDGLVIKSSAQILGETAMNIAIRLPSFILLCIGAQIVRNVVSAPLRTVVVIK
jgi:hypothetical protein